MVWKSDVSSSSTGVSISGLARMMGVTPERVYQRIAEGEIKAPTIRVSPQQKVYSLDEALAIWKENGVRGAFIDFKVSSNHSR